MEHSMEAEVSGNAENQFIRDAQAERAYRNYLTQSQDVPLARRASGAAKLLTGR
jgi:hypothetical protein